MTFPFQHIPGNNGPTLSTISQSFTDVKMHPKPYTKSCTAEAEKILVLETPRWTIIRIGNLTAERRRLRRPRQWPPED
ncbi:MAG: hypothetical protein AMJ65_11725 [Phycisphaerae bacterium SG8_4]|nr:MAG: hypothetical protein AMJ65_11725 [Phycisphaerae bacterium SG8_4]